MLYKMLALQAVRTLYPKSSDKNPQISVLIIHGGKKIKRQKNKNQGKRTDNYMKAGLHNIQCLIRCEGHIFVWYHV